MFRPFPGRFARVLSPRVLHFCGFSTGIESNIRMGPAVRFLLGQHKLDASAIPATGPHGTLLKWDVLSYFESHGSTSTNSAPNQQRGSFESSKLRKVPSSSISGIAKEAPHVYVSVSCNVSGLDSITKDAQGINPSVTYGDVITQCLLRSLLAAGLMDGNASIGIISGSSSFVLPSAATKSFVDIATLLQGTTEKSVLEGREREIEIVGSVFRYEELGVDSMYELVRPGESFSVVLGGKKQQLSFVDGLPVGTQHMEVTMSCDARVLPQGEAAKVLDKFQTFVENPYEMIM